MFTGNTSNHPNVDKAGKNNGSVVELTEDEKAKTLHSITDIVITASTSGE